MVLLLFTIYSVLKAFMAVLNAKWQMYILYISY